MTDSSAEAHVSLVVRVGTRVCAVPLEHVVETMRPLPIEAMDGAPAFIAGLSVIRGVPTPVIDLEALVENGERSSGYGRFVTLKIDQQVIALAVESVIGSRSLDARQLYALPAVLRDCRTQYIEAIGTLDERLLLVLRAARLLPEEVWATPALAEEEAR